MINTNDFAYAIREQQQRREDARIEAMRKRNDLRSVEATEVLQTEHIQPTKPLA
jgi:hypothetical protein